MTVMTFSVSYVCQIIKYYTSNMCSLLHVNYTLTLLKKWLKILRKFCMSHFWGKQVWQPYVDSTIFLLLLPSEGQSCLSGSKFWLLIKDISTSVNRNADWVTRTSPDYFPLSLICYLCNNGLKVIITERLQKSTKLVFSLIKT